MSFHRAARHIPCRGILSAPVTNVVPHRFNFVPAAQCASVPDSDSSSNNSLASPHVSVLLEPILHAFEPVDIRVFVDCTLGAAGHAEAMLSAHKEISHFVGFDQDVTALEASQQRLEKFRDRGVHCHFIHSNFRNMSSHISTLLASGALPHHPDGILMDLGVSSMQLDQADRGFSFMKDGPLDMRMDRSQTTTAETLVNELSEQELGKIIRDYGEEKLWRVVARRIVEQRRVPN